MLFLFLFDFVDELGLRLLVSPDEVQEIEVAALVLVAVVVLHDPLIEFEDFFAFLVFVDEVGPPVVLIGVLEEGGLLFLLLFLVHPLSLVFIK